MRNDLSTQLSEYFGHVDAAQGAVDVLELIHPERVRELPQPERVPGAPIRRGLLVAVATAVVVLLLAIPLILSLGEREETPPATTSATTTSSAAPPPTDPSVSPAPLTTWELPDAVSAGWRWIDTGITHYPGDPTTYVERGTLADGSYVVWYPGWVRGMEEGSEAGDPVETLLISADGVEWESANLDFLDGRISGVEFWPRMVIRALPEGESDFFGDDVELWTTDDGVDWFQLDPAGQGVWNEIGDTIVLDPIRLSSPRGMAVSIDGGGSFDIVATEQLGDARDRVVFVHNDEFRVLAWSQTAPSPTLWRSADGYSWTKVGVAADLPDDPPIYFRDIAALDDGRLVATWTRSGSGLEVRSSTYFVSDDGGLAWAHLATVPTLSLSDQAPLAVAVGTIDGWLVVSTQRGFTREFLVTRDGEEWMRLEYPVSGEHEAEITPEGILALSRATSEPERPLWIAVPPSE